MSKHDDDGDDDDDDDGGGGVGVALSLKAHKKFSRKNSATISYFWPERPINTSFQWQTLEVKEIR